MESPESKGLHDLTRANAVLEAQLAAARKKTAAPLSATPAATFSKNTATQQAPHEKPGYTHPRPGSKQPPTRSQ